MRRYLPGTHRISAADREYGFGYDPLFIPEQCGVGKSSSRPNTEGRSYAQLTPEEKDESATGAVHLEKLEAQLPDFHSKPSTAAAKEQPPLQYEKQNKKGDTIC